MLSNFTEYRGCCIRRRGNRNPVLVLCTIVLGAVLLFPGYLRAEVRFSSEAYDFGIIREERGSVTGRVTMVNLGPGPTYIRNVRTTCGCTGASFTEGMIEEGDSAIVTFTYDPERRPGVFDKSVKVYVGQDNKMHVIRIRGRVLAAGPTLDTYYPDSIGQLRLSTTMIDGKEIPLGESRNFFVTLYNPTDHAVRPTVKCPSEVLTLAIEPPVLESGDTAVLGIYLNTRREADSGQYNYEIELCSDADGMFSDIGVIRLQTDILKIPVNKTE